MHPYMAESLAEAHTNELLRQAAARRLADQFRQRRATVASLRLVWRTVGAATARATGPGSPVRRPGAHDTDACCAT